MWTTPAPPFTAFVASSIWSGVGEVNTSPGHAASSMPIPTKPPCMGSWPEPPPETRAAFPWTGASARTRKFGFVCTRTRSGCAAAMPWSASVTTSSGLLISFFTWAPSRGGTAASLREHPLVEPGAQDASDDRGNDRDPCVGPVRVSLARDRQQEVRDAGTEVPGGIDGVPGRATERQADGQHQQADQQRREARGQVVAEDCEHAEQQGERPDDLGDEVGHVVADGRPGAEHGELGPRVLRRGPVGVVRQVHQDRADDRARVLSGDVRRHVLPRNSLVGDSEPQRDRRIDVGAAEPSYRVDRDGDRQAPSEGDDDPPRVLRLGLVQHHTGDDAVPEQDQQSGSDRLRSEVVHDHPLLETTGQATWAPRPGRELPGPPPFSRQKITAGAFHKSQDRSVSYVKAVQFKTAFGIVERDACRGGRRPAPGTRLTGGPGEAERARHAGAAL